MLKNITYNEIISKASLFKHNKLKGFIEHCCTLLDINYTNKYTHVFKTSRTDIQIDLIKFNVYSDYKSNILVPFKYKYMLKNIEDIYMKIDDIDFHSDIFLFRNKLPN